MDVLYNWFILDFICSQGYILSASVLYILPCTNGGYLILLVYFVYFCGVFRGYGSVFCMGTVVCVPLVIVGSHVINCFINETIN